jgi:hypothetical protein
MGLKVEDDYVLDLIDLGIGALDYDAGSSLDSEAVEEEDRKGAATRSFNTLKNLSRNVGYGVLMSENRDKVIVGRTTPPCMTIFSAPQVGGGTVDLKGFQFDEYGYATKDEFSALFELIQNHQVLPAMTEVSSEDSDMEGPGRETICGVFESLEKSGRLERPRR